MIEKWRIIENWAYLLGLDESEWYFPSYSDVIMSRHFPIITFILFLTARELSRADVLDILDGKNCSPNGSLYELP